jgi:hypothetical protein
VKRLLAAAVIILVSCKPPTPAEQMDAILSWVGSAVMLGNGWLRHTTPDTYTRQTLSLSHDHVLQIGAELLKSPPATIDSAGLYSTLARSRSHIARMAELVEARNSPGFRQMLDSLQLDRKALKQIADKVRSQ